MLRELSDLSELASAAYKRFAPKGPVQGLPPPKKLEEALFLAIRQRAGFTEDTLRWRIIASSDPACEMCGFLIIRDGLPAAPGESGRCARCEKAVHADRSAGMPWQQVKQWVELGRHCFICFNHVSESSAVRPMTASVRSAHSSCWDERYGDIIQAIARARKAQNAQAAPPVRIRV